MDRTYFMRQALALASMCENEVPVAALIVKDGEIIAKAHNQQLALSDPTAHAEILAIRQACQVLGSNRLIGCTLFVTLEPCPMCAGALIVSGVERCVFGAFDAQYGCCGSLYSLPMDPAFHHRLLLEGGILAEEASMLLHNFFQQRR